MLFRFDSRMLLVCCYMPLCYAMLLRVSAVMFTRYYAAA